MTLREYAALLLQQPEAVLDMQVIVMGGQDQDDYCEVTTIAVHTVHQLGSQQFPYYSRCVKDQCGHCKGRRALVRIVELV